ncbi:glypican-1 [Anopheles sinensis]|uniref:Glypican-1 n=1 Tax=Anopheles sinensis TaxID=74873 RepID=A0A084W0E1_ANOSI|nr:glypican-1 [Anopheles sinensis]
MQRFIFGATKQKSPFWRTQHTSRSLTPEVVKPTVKVEENGQPGDGESIAVATARSCDLFSARTRSSDDRVTRRSDVHHVIDHASPVAALAAPLEKRTPTINRANRLQLINKREERLRNPNSSNGMKKTNPGMIFPAMLVSVCNKE